jgi:hypothetical protein
MSINKAVVCTCLLLLSARAPAARTDWRQMTVGQFRLYSTLRDFNTREVARQLQVLPVLERATARAPHNTQLLGDLARTHESLGNKAEARNCFDRIILVSDNPEERLWAQKQADSPRLREN